MKTAAMNLMLSLSVSMTLLLSGCGTPPNVGAVVTSPKPKVGPVPAVVLQTEPKPAGYFPNLFLDYFNGSSEKPKK